jgi:hypothetical protein
MARSTIGGDDPLHDLPPDEKDAEERRLRESARKLLTEGKTKDSKALNRRAINISRPPSKKAQHH